MIIKIICPICRANNELTETLKLCRRCREDLSLLHEIKSYSYKVRLQAVLEQNSIDTSLNYLKIGLNLLRE